MKTICRQHGLKKNRINIGYVKRHRYHRGDSAQLLLKNLNSRFNGNWTTDAIHAIIAICLHDKKEPVDICKDPYSALLIICDELQEWGRNIPGNKKRYEINKLQFFLNFSAIIPSVVAILFYPKKQTEDIDNLNKNLKIKAQKLNTKFSSRIKNLTIKSQCKSY